MSRIAPLHLQGRSGERYTFQTFDEVPRFKGTVPCVFYISERYRDDTGRWCHRCVDIGETDDFNRFFSSGIFKIFKKNRALSDFERGGFNAVSVFAVDDPDTRRAIARDIKTSIELSGIPGAPRENVSAR